MKGDRDQAVARDFMGLRTSSSVTTRAERERESEMGNQGPERISSLTRLRQAGEQSNLGLSSTFSNNTMSRLNSLLGNGGLSFNPRSGVGSRGDIGTSAGPGSASGNSTICGNDTVNLSRGGCFIGFNGATVQRSQAQYRRRSFEAEENKSKEEGLRRPSSSERERGIGTSKPLQELTAADIQKLSSEECRRLILDIGMQWPSWNKSLARQEQQGFSFEHESAKEALDRGSFAVNKEGGPRCSVQSPPLLPTQASHIGNNPSLSLASRALEELARTPKRFGSAAGMSLSFNTSLLENALGLNLVSRAQSNSTVVGAPMPATMPEGIAAGAVSKQSSLDASAPPIPQRFFSTKFAGRPATAQLTIFYAGTVNVYDDVPADKAQAIMLLAGSRTPWSSSLGTQGPAPSGPMPAAANLKDSSRSLPQPISVPGPSQQQQERLQSVQVDVQLSCPASAPVSSTPGQGSGLSARRVTVQQVEQQPKSSKPDSLPACESAPIRIKSSCTRVLPMARKTSLVRFLEKRRERARTNGPYILTSKRSPELSSPPPGKSTSPTRSSDAQPEIGSLPPQKLSRPSTPTETAELAEMEDTDVALERASEEQDAQRNGTAAAKQSSPVDTEMAIPLVGS